MRSKRSNVSLSFMGLVAIVCGMTVAVEAQLPDVIGRVTSLFGKPSLEEGGARRKLDLGMGFANRDRIATGYADAASLLLATNTVVKLDGNSAARVVEETGRTNVSLEFGTLEVFVASRAPGAGSVYVRDGGVTCEANHAVFWASYDAIRHDGYYACEDASLILHGHDMDKPVTLHVNQSATFHNGKLVAVGALDRAQLAEHVHTLNSLARIAQRQGAEVAEQRSRAVDVNIAMQQLIPGSVSRTLTASPQTTKGLIAHPSSGSSTSDQNQTNATSTDTGTAAPPAAAAATPGSAVPVLPAAATPSPISLPPAAAPGAPVSAAAVAPTPAAAVAAALPAVPQDVVNAVTTTPPTAAASAAANAAATVGTPITVTGTGAAVTPDLAAVTPTGVPPTAVTPAAVSSTPATPTAAAGAGTSGTPATPTPTAGTPVAGTAAPGTTPLPAATPTSVTPVAPTLDTSAAAVPAAAAVAPAPTTPAATPVVAAAPTAVVPAAAATVTPVTAAPTAPVTATPTAALVSSVSTLSASTPTVGSTTGSANASLNSAIQSQSVASSVAAAPPVPQFDLTVLLDPGQHLSFNLVDATTGGAGANTVDVAVTAGGKTYLDSGQVNLTTAGQSFSPSVKAGAVQVQVDASSANTATVVAGIDVTSTVQSGNANINESLNPGDTATVNVNANANTVSGDSVQLARPRRGSGAPGSGPPSFDLLRAGPGRHVHAHAAPVVK